MDIEYHCKCGCILKKEDLRTVSMKTLGSGKKYSGLICKEHYEDDGVVVNRYTFCLDCEGRIKNKRDGSPSKRCKKCGKEHNAKRAKKRKRKLIKEREEAKKNGTPTPRRKKRVLRRKSDKNRAEYCDCYYECHIGGKRPRCATCQEYIPIFRGVDPAAMYQVMWGRPYV
jgi:Zn-finger protein